MGQHGQSWNTIRTLLSGNRPTWPVGYSEFSLVRMCRANRVGPLIYSIARQDTGIDSSLFDPLYDQVKEAAAINLASDSLLSLLFDKMSIAGIECLPIKGAVFRHLLYPDPAFRVSVDLDLLVSRSNFQKSRDIIESVGFRYVPFDRNRPVTEANLYEHLFIHPDFNTYGCIVEIHRGFSHSERYPIESPLVFQHSLNLDAFCARTNTIPPSSLPFPAGARFMTPEHSLVHQFIHNATHNFNIPLVSAVDAKWIIEKWRPDWNEVIELAKRWRLSTAGYFSLRIAKDCLSTEVPEWVLAALEPSRLRRTWLERFISTEGVLATGPDDDPIITFFRYKYGLRLQQATVALPLIDDSLQAAQFGITYIWLRFKDIVANLLR